MTDYLVEAKELSVPKCSFPANLSESCPIYIAPGTCLDLVIETYPCYGCFKRIIGSNVTSGCMKTDGNFVLYRESDEIWTTDTPSYPGAYAKFDTENNFVIVHNERSVFTTNQVAECIGLDGKTTI